MVEEILNQIGELTPILILGLGFSIGLEHAFESDHIAAVSTQISKTKFSKKSSTKIKSVITKSSLLGVIWGAGHTTTLVLMGLLIYGFSMTIQEYVFSSFEFLVGIMLVFLGIITISNKKFFKLRHKHPHQHKDGTIHFDEHQHGDLNHSHRHRSYLIGLIHGLAGSGSLVVLTASTLDNVNMVLSFISIFGLGSIIGMSLISGILGLPFVITTKIPYLQKIFRYVAGIISFVIGANIMFQIGIIDNLFGL